VWECGSLDAVICLLFSLCIATATALQQNLFFLGDCIWGNIY